MSDPANKRGMRVPALLKAVLVVVVAWLLFQYGLPHLSNALRLTPVNPVTPRSLLIEYMLITVVGVLLYFSFDEARWADFNAPILATLRRKDLWPLRWLLLLGVPALVAWVSYENLRPSLDAPVELRQVHPAPPSSLKVYGKTYDLTKLENPLRSEVLALLPKDRKKAVDRYEQIVADGRTVFYQNCFYCHGDALNGRGPVATAFDPRPANFQDQGTIPQLQEAYLFWRITTGGPGLPKEGAPWNSAMPVWHRMLEEKEVWSVITFLYDYIGQVPRMWDPETSKAVTGLSQEINARRKDMKGKALYEFRCAVCHGENGAGDGPAADFLYPRPRDFTLGLFKYKTSPGTLPPRDEDLERTIGAGLTGTGMPPWKDFLSAAQIKGLVPIIKGFDTAAAWAPEDAPDEAFDDEGHYTKTDFRVIKEIEPTAGRVAFSEESVARGAKVFKDICSKCHGEAGRGNITTGKRLKDDWEHRIWPRDLNKPWTWRVSNVAGEDAKSRDATIANIYQRLSIGIPGTPMPAQRAVEEGNKDPLSLRQRWDVANFAYALREKAAPAPGKTSLIAARRVDGALPASAGDPAWRQASPVTLRLAPDVIHEPRLFTPLNDAVTVRVLYNAEDIAFLLEIDDRTDSRPGLKYSEEIQDENLKLYPDAVAIELPRASSYVAAPVVEKPLFRHGDAAHPTAIWYWNAGGVKPGTAARTVVFDATGPERKLVPRADTSGVEVAGKWSQGRWRVVMRRARKPKAKGDIGFADGQFIPIAFADWDGSNGEKGAKHTFTAWYWLLLPPEPNLAGLYGVPAGIGLLVFFGGLLLVRSQRRRAEPTVV